VELEAGAYTHGGKEPCELKSDRFRQSLLVHGHFQSFFPGSMDHFSSHHITMIFGHFFVNFLWKMREKQEEASKHGSNQVKNKK
jgi:hypothetical protein